MLRAQRCLSRAWAQPSHASVLLAAQTRGMATVWRTLPSLRPEEQLSRRRTSRLVKLLRGDERERASAKELFDAMLRRRNVGTSQLGVMLKACHSSYEVRELMERAESDGVQLESSAFNIMINRLQIEGRPNAEIRSVLQEMNQRGLPRT